MNREKYLEKTLSIKQKEAYTQIKEQGKLIAKGHERATCKILMQLGLIIPNPESDNQYEYILKGKALDLLYAQKLPLPKKIVEEINKENGAEETPPVEQKPKHKVMVHVPSFTRPPATYSNTSREQHVEKWINTEVPAQRKRIGYNQQKKTA